LLRDCIIRAGELAGGGGEAGLIEYLRRQSLENPTAYLQLLAKVLPTQIAGDSEGGPLTVEIVRFEIVYESDGPRLVETDFKRIPPPDNK
jgi:hypothetical protein